MFFIPFSYVIAKLQHNRRKLSGFSKTSPNVQVIGFTENDSYIDVLRRGVEGLGVKCDVKKLSLICSSGLVPDSPIGGDAWTLGLYIQRNGGNQNRSKKVWGIYIPCDIDIDQATVTGDSVSTS